MSSYRPLLPRSITLEPIEDESLTGYIFRLAFHQRLPTARMLAAACGFDRFTDRPEPDWLTALANHAGVERDKLVAISKGPPDRQHGWWRGQRFNHSVLERRGSADRRICPSCLAESVRHRAVWDIKYIAICPDHRCLLVDQCPKCGRPLRWLGRDLARCRCGHDLRAIVSPAIGDADVAASAAVFGLLGEERFQAQADRVRSLPPFQDLVGSDIADFLFRLGLERMGRQEKAFSTEKLGVLAWEAHIALRLGLEAVDDWPTDFFHELDAMRERWGGNSSQTLYRCIGAVEFWLAHLQQGSRGTAIAAALAEYRALDAARRRKPAPVRASRRPW